MVPFAIGSETAGSITYPAARCGVTALRPTFGTVARTDVMSISESLVFIHELFVGIFRVLSIFSVTNI
jgi:Asp-tRNA(Asn)/Glu-tRNA(Gln) amidotransferase A subunit family amidase